MSHYRAIQRDTEVVHSLERGLKQSLIYLPRIPIRGTLRGAQDKRLCHGCSYKDEYSSEILANLRGYSRKSKLYSQSSENASTEQEARLYKGITARRAWEC